MVSDCAAVSWQRSRTGDTECPSRSNWPSDSVSSGERNGRTSSNTFSNVIIASKTFIIFTSPWYYSNMYFSDFSSETKIFKVVEFETIK